MTLWRDLALAAASVNLLLLVVLGSVWFRSYRRHGASHTLGLLVFAGFLVVEIVLWVYFYSLHPGFVGWFDAAGVDVQVGMTLLCVLELVALFVLVRITWR